MSDRIPPHNDPAEMAVLGAMMIDPQATRVVQGIIGAEDFYRPHHQAIFAAAVSVAGAGMTVDVLTVRDALGSQGKLQEVGGVPYLGQIMDSVPSAQSAGDYARLVRKASTCRAALDRVHAIERMAYRGDADGAVREAHLLARSLDTGTDCEHDVVEVIHGLHLNSPAECIPSGVPLIDNLRHKNGGLYRYELNYIAGETNAGKTLLATQIIGNLLMRGKNVAILSHEMTADQIVQRIMLQLTGYEDENDAADRGGKAGYHRWLDVAGKIRETSPKVFDGSLQMGTPAEKVVGWLERKHAEKPLDAWVCDYVQLLGLAPTSRRVEGWEEQRTVCEMLRTFVKRTGSAGIVLSQQNFNEYGGVDMRGSKQHQMASALTLSLNFHRPNKQKGEEADPDMREVLVTKNRFGRRGNYRMRIREENLSLVEVVS